MQESFFPKKTHLMLKLNGMKIFKIVIVKNLVYGINLHAFNLNKFLATKHNQISTICLVITVKITY